MKHLLILSILLSIFSCKKDNLEIGSIEGNYKAEYFNNNPAELYPINGKTISLKIELVNDKAKVSVTSDVNGIYSPGESKTYSNSVIVQNRNNKDKISGYTIYLDGKVADPLTNVILVYSDGSADYIFTPPDYTKGQVFVRMKKI